MSGLRGAAVAVALATLLGFARTLAYDFVWDDALLIQRSQRLQQWTSLPAVLTSHFWSEVHEGSHYYRPLVSLSFFLDMQAWGINPLGFHLTNLFAHLATALAVLALARRLTGSVLAAAVAAVAFALHPIHTESVTFVSGRTDVLATLFFLLALLGYVRWRQEGGPLAFAGSLVAFFLGLAAKEVAVTLPLILVLYDRLVGPKERMARDFVRALMRYAAYGGVIALYLVVRMAALGALVESDPGTWGTFLTRVLTTTKIVATYAWLTLVPFPANPYYVIVPVRWPPPMDWWVAAIGLAVLMTLTLWAAWRTSMLGFAALWFWVTLIPSVGVNLLPVPTAIMAERFLYLPSVGYCLLLGMGVQRVLGGGRTLGADQLRPAPALGLTALLLGFVLLTLWRNEPWKDHYSLYSYMVEMSPQSDLPHVNLALVHLPRGEVLEAYAHFKRGAEIAPQNPRALVGLGLTETMLGNKEGGLKHALEGARHAPNNPNVLAFLAQLYLLREEPEHAVTVYEESLRLFPDQAHATILFARALGRVGRTEDAEVTLARAHSLIRPGTGEAALLDRVTAEVMGPRAPTQARAALERYVARLRALPEPTRAEKADLIDAERQLAVLVGGVR
jgi:tetratricopeptide (TPR) repeat protein